MLHYFSTYRTKCFIIETLEGSSNISCIFIDNILCQVCESHIVIANILIYTHIILSQDSLSICSKLLDKGVANLYTLGVFFLSMPNPNCFLGWCQDLVVKWLLSMTSTSGNNILIPTHIATCGVIIFLLFNIAHISLYAYGL
jgi:hypothetical protein